VAQRFCAKSKGVLEKVAKTEFVRLQRDLNRCVLNDDKADPREQQPYLDVM
jgi:hypothetical protein